MAILVAVQTVVIRRQITTDVRATLHPSRNRMVLTPEDDPQSSLIVPYSPNEVAHSNIGSDYAEVDRAGRVPALVYQHEQLPKMSFTLYVADKTQYISPVTGGVMLVLPAISVLQALQRYAKLGTRIRITYGTFESGMWRITSIGITSSRRDSVSNEITVANAELELTRVSDIVVGVGPVSGGVTPPPTPPSAPPQTRTYDVKAGDTLWAIATKYYGSGTNWKNIADANGVTDPRKLQVGKVLVIP